MRVLTYGLSADKMGGIETFLLNMNKHMSDACVFDYVIERNEKMGNSTIHQAAIDEKGGRTYYIAPKNDVFQCLMNWKQLLKIHGNDYNAVYFNVYSMSWFAPMIVCKNRGMKVFIHAHNNMLHDCGTVIKVLHRVGRAVISRMDIVRLTNSDLSSRFIFGDIRRETLIYNAISLDRFGYNSATRDKLRTELKLTGKHVYGFTGRIMYQKNPLQLIEIFDAIQKKDDLALLLVAGDGDLMDSVKSLVKEKDLVEKVILLGNVRNVEDYYQAMDVFLLPSRFEGLGIVLIEAQAAGLPCITSAHVVPREAKITELLEYLPLDQTEEWAKLAVEMAQYEYKREKYKSIIENSSFNIEREAQRLEKLLKNTVKQQID